MKTLDLEEVNLQTTMNALRIKETLARAKALEKDAKRAARAKALLCRWCFYNPRASGQAFTSYDCARCGAGCSHPNTDTPRLCEACAESQALCKRCTGDVEGKQRKELL